MAEERKTLPKIDRRLRIFTILNLAALILLFTLTRYVGEATWFTMLLTYVPQPLFLFASILLILVSTIRKRWLWASLNAIAFFSAALALCGPHIRFDEPSTDPKLRVLTFNIQLGAKGIDNVLGLIRQQDPDVFCLQECNGLLDQITQGMPKYHVVGIGGLAIGSKLPVTSSRTIPLASGSPNRPIQEVTVTWQGRNIRITNVHLVPIFIDKLLVENPAALPAHLRLTGAQHDEQIDQLVRYADSLEDPLVLCGDFNSPALGPAYQRISSRLRDSFDAVGNGFGYTIPAQFPLMRLDYVYAGHGLTPTFCVVVPQIASDHRAIYAEMDLDRP